VTSESAAIIIWEIFSDKNQDHWKNLRIFLSTFEEFGRFLKIVENSVNSVLDFL
jgi:hypothetical protein